MCFALASLVYMICEFDMLLCHAVRVNHVGCMCVHGFSCFGVCVCCALILFICVFVFDDIMC